MSRHTGPQTAHPVLSPPRRDQVSMISVCSDGARGASRAGRGPPWPWCPCRGPSPRPHTPASAQRHPLLWVRSAQHRIGPPALHPWRWADAAASLRHPCSRRGHVSFPAALPSPLAALSASRAPTAALPGAWVSPELGAVGARGGGARSVLKEQSHPSWCVFCFLSPSFHRGTRLFGGDGARTFSILGLGPQHQSRN